MKLPFYRAFEERYYAPREYVRNLRRQYLPYVSAVLNRSGATYAIDIGCGRGEWLELMGEMGVCASGVDLDSGMLKDCLDRGLNAKLEDGLSALKKLPDQSQSVVSAFHVVEHMAFDDLRSLIAEAHRVLVPGGLILLETPNPENLVVGVKNFYLDPTHQRPLPSELLSFAVEYGDFGTVKILRLQESADILSKDDLKLHDVFSGASPDYAVIGQKDDPLGSTRSIEHVAFSPGASLAEVSAFYDEKMAKRLEALAERKALAEAEKRMLDQGRQTSATLDFLARRIELLSIELSLVKAELATSHTFIKAQADELRAVYESTSWSVTAPVRRIVGLFKRLVLAVREGRIASGSKRRLKSIAIRIAIAINRHPKLATVISKSFARFPILKKKIARVLGSPQRGLVDPVNPDELSPRVREIYVSLKAACGDRG